MINVHTANGDEWRSFSNFVAIFEHLRSTTVLVDYKNALDKYTLYNVALLLTDNCTGQLWLLEMESSVYLRMVFVQLF